MPTKAEITKLAASSCETVNNLISNLVITHKEYLRGEMVWVHSLHDQAKSVVEIIDLLVAPLLTYSREHIYHMPMDTYLLLSESVTRMLEAQEMAWDIGIKAINKGEIK